jgi:aryl-phospho-beta-D-glucosidase BglC (GH1 family)
MLLAFLVTIDTPVLGEGENALHYNRLPGRGINLGDALEARGEREGGVTLKSQYFREITSAGFNSVRIPIRWSTHAGYSPHTRSHVLQQSGLGNQSSAIAWPRNRYRCTPL